MAPVFSIGSGMHWIFAIVGIVFGSIAAEERWFFGALAGFLFGWLLGKQAGLRGELSELRDKVKVLDAQRLSDIARRSQQAGVEPPPPMPPAQEPIAPAPVVGTAPDAPTIEAPPQIVPAPVTEPLEAAVVEPATSVANESPDVILYPAQVVGSAAPDRPWSAWEAPAAPASAAWKRPTDGWEERTIAAVKRWFTEGNVPVKIGMLVLFVGVSALLKYAADQGLFSLPIELRLSAVAAAAVGALAFGWRQRAERPAFGLSLQGGALGVLLLTVFAAFRLYHLLPAGAAFALLLVVVGGAALLAVLQDAMALAVLGIVGGFLAPVLISTGGGSHVALFSYYAVLNAAVFFVAWIRPWRVLNLVGFAFTFVIGVGWGQRYYQPEFFATTEPFLLLFVAFYLAITVLYALRSPGERHGLVDGTLTFGVPLLGFPLQAALLKGDNMALAYSALGLAAVYAVLAMRLWRVEALRTLALSFAALALGIASLSIPLAFDARVTASTWALEGAALVWLGLRQAQTRQVVAGLILQGLACFAWLISLDRGALGDTPILNGACVGALLLALALLFSAWRLERAGRWLPVQWTGLVLGSLVWAVAGLLEVARHAPAGENLEWVVILLAVSLASFGLARQVLSWPRLSWPMLVAAAAALPLALACWMEPIFAGTRGLAWLAWAAASAFALRCLRDPIARGLSIAHVLILACIAILLGSDGYARMLRVEQVETAWAVIAVALPLGLMVWAGWRRPQWLAWPIADLFDRYQWRWLLPSSVALALWWLLSQSHGGDAAPLPYMPVINPLELAQLGVALLLLRLALTALPQQHSLVASLGCLTGFVFISMATLRGVHHLAALEWHPRLLSAMLAQTSLTVVWSILGVSAWVIGSKRGSRPIWLAGAVLMGVVLGKLVLVDRQHMGNIPGIVSFLAVGVLLTVVGYLAPSPPKAAPPESAA